MDYWRRRLRSGRLPERFEKFANAFLVCFRVGPRQGRRSRCRSSPGLAWTFARFSRRSGEQLEQKRDCDEQKEKEIFEMKSEHLFKTLNRESLHRFHESRITANHVPPSVRGLSVPAIDSRIEVSAWTFFIR